MTTYQIIYWRDIPAQVQVLQERRRISRPLSDRFQVAIDEAAMRDGTFGSDAYLEQWRHCGIGARISCGTVEKTDCERGGGIDADSIDSPSIQRT
jgi:hypothetical protein